MANVDVALWIKARLEADIGVSVFVAHEDVEPTDEWREVIAQRLRDCDALIALLSKEYDESDWCDQESGFAAVAVKPVVTIMLGRKPRGFLNKFQGLRWDGSTEESRRASLRQVYPKLAESGLIDVKSLISRLAESSSYSTAEERSVPFVILGKVPPSSLQPLVDAIRSNDQVRDSYGARGLLEPLLAAAGVPWPRGKS